jgi:hypothetical protein
MNTEHAVESQNKKENKMNDEKERKQKRRRRLALALPSPGSPSCSSWVDCCYVPS